MPNTNCLWACKRSASFFGAEPILTLASGLQAVSACPRTCSSLLPTFVTGDPNRRQTFYNEEEARDVCRTMIGSVKYLHELGVVHRDLKPENLLLTTRAEDATIKLADFGFACSVADGLKTEQCGSPGYVAPEILKAAAYGTVRDRASAREA